MGERERQMAIEGALTPMQGPGRVRCSICGAMTDQYGYELRCQLNINHVADRRLEVFFDLSTPASFTDLVIEWKKDEAEI